jgi:hypothetical protein
MNINMFQEQEILPVDKAGQWAVDNDGGPKKKDINSKQLSADISDIVGTDFIDVSPEVKAATDSFNSKNHLVCGIIFASLIPGFRKTLGIHTLAQLQTALNQIFPTSDPKEMVSDAIHGKVKGQIRFALKHIQSRDPDMLNKIIKKVSEYEPSFKTTSAKAIVLKTMTDWVNKTMSQSKQDASNSATQANLSAPTTESYRFRPAAGLYSALFFD